MRDVRPSLSARRNAPLATGGSPVAPWKNQVDGACLSLHQLAPYIGRLKVGIATDLVQRLSAPGDLIVDPFCGSGTVPLEAISLGRNVICGDSNPYAVLLTRAKLSAPRTLAEALRRALRVAREAALSPKQRLQSVPRWVRRFFHHATLREVLAFRDTCTARGDHFLLACLLSILHHQRPGFLSFPSSHLVPYLRDKLYPRARFPELYLRRTVLDRMIAKIERSYRVPLANVETTWRVRQWDAQRLPVLPPVQAVITSPPYMNELDYVRDNRLRLWFIRRQLPSTKDIPIRSRESTFVHLMRSVCQRLHGSMRLGGYFAFVLGEVTRGGATTSPHDLVGAIFREEPFCRTYHHIATYEDTIPDIRRSRRECRGTKREVTLIFQRVR